MNAKESLVAVLTLSASLAASAARAEDFRLEKQLPLAAGGSLSVRSEAGGIEVRGAAGATEAAITVTSDRADFAEKYAVRIEAPRPDRIEVVVERKSRGVSSWFGDSWTSKTRIEVVVPKFAAVQADSSGGGIEVSDVDGAVRAESSGGGVHVTNLGGAATLSSSGGSISADNVAGDVDASSSGGSVKIHEAGGAVVAESSGGSVSVGFGAGNARGGRLDSSGGGVSASVDPTVGLEIDASSSGGSVDCDLPITVRGKMGRDNVHGKLNGGGALLKLSSSGGGVSLAER